MNRLQEVGMKVAVCVCVCVILLQVTCVKARLLTQSDAKLIHNNLSARSTSTRNGDFPILSRQRPLFARRMYDRQKVYEMRHRGHPVHPKALTPKTAEQAPGVTRCSGISESCLPHSGCCDPCASCHCRFFNAICLCRKTNTKTKAFCGKVA